MTISVASMATAAQASTASAIASGSAVTAAAGNRVVALVLYEQAAPAPSVAGIAWPGGPAFAQRAHLSTPGTDADQVIDVWYADVATANTGTVTANFTAAFDDAVLFVFVLQSTEGAVSWDPNASLPASATITSTTGTLASAQPTSTAPFFIQAVGSSANVESGLIVPGAWMHNGQVLENSGGNNWEMGTWGSGDPGTNTFGAGVAMGWGLTVTPGTALPTLLYVDALYDGAPPVPYFGPPEWAWALIDPVSGDFITALTTATARQLNFPIDAGATAQFTMPGSVDLSGPAPETALVKELATDLYVTRNGRPVFRGRVGTSADTHANDSDTINFTAIDYRGLLDHRIIWPGSGGGWNTAGTTLTFTTTEQTDIAWQLVAGTQATTDGDLGISEGAGIGTSGVTRDRTYTAGVPLAQTIDELANVENGFEWEIDTNLNFNVFHPQRFRDQTASQVLALGRGLTELVSTVNTDAYANAVFYTGHQPETTPIQQIPPGGIPAGIGRWEAQVTDPNVVLQTTANEQAKAARLNAQQLAPALTLTMSPAWWEPGSIWLGDVVQVQVRDGRLDIPNPDDDGHRRVVTIAITLDDDGTETVVLTANVPVPPDGTTDPPPPPAPGGAGKVPKLSKRLVTLHHRVSKLELVAAGATGPATVSSVYANILDYGGSASASTDNASALYAALATGKPVWVPEGRFGLSSVGPDVSVPQVVIHGPGELVCLSATSSPLTCAFQTFVELVGLSFSSSAAGPSPGGGPWVACGSTNRVTITGCQFTNVALRLTTASNLGASSTAPCANVVVRGNVFSYAGNGGSHSIACFAEAVNPATIADNQVYVNASAGCLNLEANGITNGPITVTGNQLVANPATGYYAVVAASSQPMVVTGNLLSAGTGGVLGYGQAGGTAGPIVVSGNVSVGGDFVVGSGAGPYRVSGNQGMADVSG